MRMFDPAAGSKTMNVALATIAAAATDLPIIQTLTDDLGLAPAQIQGALLGAAVFVILGDGGVGRRFSRGLAAFLISWATSGAAIGFLARVAAPSPAIERAISALISSGGVYLVEAWMRRLDRQGDSIIDDIWRRTRMKRDPHIHAKGSED